MDTSRLRIALALCLLATHCFAANPTVFIPWTAPRGSGTITVTTNPAAGTFTIGGGGDSTNVWTTNASYIFPRFPTNSIHINRTKGGIIIGTNGIGSVPDSEVFRAVFDSTMGDPSAATWTLEANVTGSGTYGGSLLNVNTAGDAYFALYNHKGAGFGLEFNPNAVVGVTPFALNSSVNQTSGMLLSVSNFDVGKWNVAHNGVIWSATNRFAFGTTTNVWPLTNAVAGQVLTSAGGAGAQMYWSTVSASGPTFADLVWTNDLTSVKPSGIGANTNHIKIYPYGGVAIGPDVQSWYGNLDVNEAMITVHSNLNAFTSTIFDHFFVHANGVAENFMDLDADRSLWFLYWDGTGGEDGDIRLEARNRGTVSSPIASPEFKLRRNGVELTVFEPASVATATAYTFDTGFGHTSGNLSEWKNLGVTQLSLSFSNGIATPAITAYGAVSKAWQFGAGSNNVDVLLRATNMAEVTIEGVGAVLIPYARK